MQKPGAPVLKESRHRDRLDKIRGEGVGGIDLLGPRYGKDVCDQILCRILSKNNMTLVLWEHLVKGTCVCADAHLQGNKIDGFTGFYLEYLGIIFWGRGPEWQKATSFLGIPGACDPKIFLK